MIRLSDSARLFFTLGSLVLAVICIYYLRPILAPLSFSFILAAILLPATAFLERKGLSPNFAAIITVTVASFLVIGTIVAASWQISSLIDNAQNISAQIDSRVHKGVASLEKAYPQLRKQTLINYRQRTEDLFKKVGDYIGSAGSGLAALVTNALLMPLFVFFMLSYRQFFRKFLHRVIESEDKYVDQVLNKIYRVTRSYLSGMITVMAIVGVMNAIGLSIIGVPYAIFFAILASLLMVIPYIGVFVGSLLPAIMALLTFSSPLPALAVIAWMWVVQLIEGNLITPNLVGSKVSINPFAAIISLIAMGQLWDVAGLVIAIPFVAILKIILDAIPSTQPYGMLLGEVKYEKKKAAGPKSKQPKQVVEMSETSN